MNNIERELSVKKELRGLPCAVCTCVATCETNCITFNAYVNSGKVKDRENIFLSFSKRSRRYLVANVKLTKV